MGTHPGTGYRLGAGGTVVYCFALGEDGDGRSKTEKEENSNRAAGELSEAKSKIRNSKSETRTEPQSSSAKLISKHEKEKMKICELSALVSPR